MKRSAASFDEYFTQSGGYEPDLRTLDTVIRTHAPHLEPVIMNGMSGTMLGYGPMLYRPKSAKSRTTWPLVAIAGQKQYISLYICAIIHGQYVAEAYAKQLGNVSTGKSCIRFRKLTDVNQDALTALLTDLDARYARGEKLYSA